MNLLLYLATVLIWGSTWIAIAWQLGPIRIEVSVLYRFLLAALALFALLTVSGRFPRLPWAGQRYAALLGALLFSTNFLCFYHATLYIPSGLSAVIFALVVSTVPDVARVARGAAVGVMGQEFMEAGRAVGLRNGTLIWRYLTLNCISTIAVFLTLRFGQVILVGSALGFLGMGAQPPVAELGMMAAQGRDFLFMAPHIATIPSLAIFVIVLTANLLGDAVRDVLDPRLQQ